MTMIVILIYWIGRLLTAEEMKSFSQCKKYKAISPGGNLINGASSWQISGGRHVSDVLTVFLMKGKIG